MANSQTRPMFFQVSKNYFTNKTSAGLWIVSRVLIRDMKPPLFQHADPGKGPSGEKARVGPDGHQHQQQRPQPKQCRQRQHQDDNGGTDGDNRAPDVWNKQEDALGSLGRSCGRNRAR